MTTTTEISDFFSKEKEQRVKERNKTNYYKNKAKYNKRRTQNIRLKQYNISEEQFELYKNIQDNRCAICGTDDPRGRGRTLHVDHCHEMGKVRGLLCQKCNTGLGLLGDNLKNIEKAYIYMLLAANDNIPPTEEP